jgi:hypothetical protein
MGWLDRRAKASVPAPKCIFQRVIEDVNADFEKTLDGIAVPAVAVGISVARFRHNAQ